MAHASPGRDRKELWLKSRIFLTQRHEGTKTQIGGNQGRLKTLPSSLPLLCLRVFVPLC